MPPIVPQVRFAVKQRLLRHLRRCRQAGLRLRYLIVLNLLNGRGAYPTLAGEVRAAAADVLKLIDPRTAADHFAERCPPPESQADDTGPGPTEGPPGQPGRNSRKG
jgi:hypothetical protein